ncbi:MAG: NADH-quinone oxidoreductase subunit C [Thermoplasmata archaeon]|nr:NADH-quinone oxidoreductase subunit C [Thermoplasmata archaeon]
MATDDLATQLAPRAGANILAVEPFQGLTARVRFRPEGALDVFRAVHDDLGYDHLSMVGAIDWVDHREVFYIVWSDVTKQYLGLSADLTGDAPHIESATPVWPSANWHEREAWELVGVAFDHHPDMRHLLMPDDYAFHPLLRSFKLHEPEELEVKSRSV